MSSRSHMLVAVAPDFFAGLDLGQSGAESAINVTPTHGCAQA